MIQYEYYVFNYFLGFFSQILISVLNKLGKHSLESVLRQHKEMVGRAPEVSIPANAFLLTRSLLKNFLLFGHACEKVYLHGQKFFKILAVKVFIGTHLSEYLLLALSDIFPQLLPCE